MNMLFHYQRENASVKRLKSLLDSYFSNEKIATSNSIGEMNNRLKAEQDSLSVALFYVSHPEEIQNLLMLKNKLNGTHLILVMPERNTDSIKLTYKLNPLLTCFADGDYSEVADIIERLHRGDAFTPVQRSDGKTFRSLWDQKVIF
ncbi:MAG: hypothetical protein R6V02_00015 [Candidatus Aminicenantes bacterium]